MTSETPSSALQKMLADNQTFAEDLPPDEFDHIQHEQNPYITVLTCCDSRVRIRAFLADEQPSDDVFVIRNIGNQLAATCGSVDFGVRHLHTPLLLILGHTRCGAIKAACSDYRGESLHLVQELNGLHLPVRDIDPNGDPEIEWLRAVERNVHYQCDLAMQRYREKVADGSLAIVGCVYDFANLYQRGIGRIILLNVNGESGPDISRDSPLLAPLSKEMLDLSLVRNPITSASKST
ncbi:carbonic anhydrase [Cerasicoccus arenae]|uniref:carbonic anhydrase n=1 Tax=Cerasicoccus arenae TaxID=424488 RepID=A0A8J3DGY9_9BACT|nr:carbonic anhydrase [Cerasicoccus arenae]MBK1859727.1 carbonic anhydrase [Cerasicoccus arenae]GHC06014.1 carbonic anhydrase 2 [Cerasicoccus arenae]